jgi:S1-C subfamily serine protease
MSKRILIFLFMVCTISACTTYNSAIKRYEGLPGAKAFASAYDTENRWYVGYGYNASSVTSATQTALHACEKGRLERKIQSPCKVSIAHDRNSKPVSVNADGNQLFKNFQEAVDHYQSKPKGRVLLVAYDSPTKWVCSFGSATHGYEKAQEAANSKCERLRESQNISSPCKVFAIDDEFYYNKDKPNELLIVKHPVEKPIPSTPPASTTKPPPAPKPELKKEEEISYGTGFAVRSDGYILTAYHVVAGADVIMVYYQKEKAVRAKLVKPSSPINDLAILKIDKRTPNYLELEEPGEAYIGERVFTVGFPVMELLGSEPKYTDGTISSVSGPHDEASFMQISVPVQPGNSGGPLLNEKGKVVGIITATAAVSRFLKTTGTLPQNVNWAVKADIARTLFKVPKPSKTGKFDRQAIITRARDSVCIIGVVKSE